MSIQIVFTIVGIMGNVLSGLSLLLVTAVFWPRRLVSGIPYLIMTLFSISVYNLLFSFLLLISIPYRITQPPQPLSISSAISYGIFLFAFIPFSVSPVLFSLQYVGVTNDNFVIGFLKKYFPEPIPKE